MKQRESILLEIEKEGLDVPKHLAIIMDGNGRWAQSQNKPRIWGHEKGTRNVEEVVRVCAQIGVKYLSLYAFSLENWGRPQAEVDGLMNLFNFFIKRKLKTLKESNVKLTVIGRVEDLPLQTQSLLQDALSALSENSGMTLNIALSYSGKREISDACIKITKKVLNQELRLEDINPETLSKYMYQGDMPHPDLLIRTSGEQRISNFLLWQLAYSELYFTKTCWPDFTQKDLFKAISEYNKRGRRYGLTQQQIDSSISSGLVKGL